MVERKSTKFSLFGNLDFREHWLRFPLLVLLVVQTFLGLNVMSLFVSVYPFFVKSGTSLFQVCLTPVFFFVGVFSGCSFLFFFRKYLSMSNTMRIVFVLHGAGTVCLVFLRKSFGLVLLGEFLVGFAVCFYSHHQSEFCLHWFSVVNRSMVKSIMSASLFLSAGASNVFPVLFLTSAPKGDRLNDYLRMLCYVTSGISFVLLFLFREHPPKGYGTAPAREPKPEDILDNSQINSLSVKNMETINPVPPMSPRTSNLAPLPDLSKFNLFFLLMRYSSKLFKNKYFSCLVLLYALNHSSLAVVTIFLNLLAGNSGLPPVFGSVNILLVAVFGVLSSMLHALYSTSFKYHALLLLAALASCSLLLLSLYLQ